MDRMAVPLSAGLTRVLAFTLLACINSCAPTANPEARKPTGQSRTSGSAGSGVAPDVVPQAGIYASDRWVVITDEFGNAIPAATVYVQTPSLTYKYTTAPNGAVDLPSVFLQEPKWVEVWKDGYVPIREMDFPTSWPQRLRLKKERR